MAEVNGSSEETAVKSETPELQEKADVNGGGANAGEQAAEEKVEPKIELDPEQRAKKIKRQIEYYFGDYNLPTDKFLREQVKLKEGWVPLETLLKFKRLAALTQDPEVIVEALAGSEVIQINEEKTELRRHPDKPLPEESEARRKEILTRSVYVKGFPQEGFTIDSALDFFEQYGPTDDVVMRFYQDKATKSWKFKGSVFVKYPTKDAAAAFLALEEVKFEDTPLIRLWQEDYIDQKRKERLDQKLQKRKRPEGDDERTKPEEDRGLPKDATLHITKCPAGLTREQVKEKIETLGVSVAFIDFNKGDDEGWVRLHDAGTAATVIKECEDGVLEISEGVQVELRVLEGEEETTFLTTARQNMNARRARGNRGRRGGRGGRGGGGGGNWRKRKHDISGEPQAKAVKTNRRDSGDEGD